MGCAMERESVSDAEEFMGSGCRVLCFHNRQAETISNVFHRYSPNFHLTDKQLNEALKEIDLPFDDTCKEIYKFFLERPKTCKFIIRQGFASEYEKNDPLYSVKKLSTFALLLGEGNLKEKFKCLFRSYDIDMSNYLSRWEITVLIGDVLDICLIIIPEIAIIVHPEQQESIARYKSSLSFMRNNFLGYFKYLILEDKLKEISCEKFVKIMQHKDLNFLMDHKRLRKFVYKAHEEGRELSAKLYQDFEAAPKRPKRNKEKKRKRKCKTPCPPALND